MIGTTNSKVTRVRPIFHWLTAHGGDLWPARLVKMADGVTELKECGLILNIDLTFERKVPATRSRLIWMLKNAEKLVPLDGSRWAELRKRVGDQDRIDKFLASLKAGEAIPRELVLEGKTNGDCLIECEHALIWMEGKRFDWLSPSTTWDVSRDQLARNVEAVWSLAQVSGKDYRLLICHEHPLKHHEVSLLEGYRTGAWSAGWPHLSEEQRREFSTRIGTL